VLVVATVAHAQTLDLVGTLTVLQFDPSPVASEPEVLPSHTTLGFVYPNPARDRAKILFTLTAPTSVRLTILDTLGREVALLSEGARGAGEHIFALDATVLQPGVYIVRLDVDGRTETRRLTLVR